MYAKSCYRTLDRPLEFFGLEVEDWGLLILASGLLAFVAGPVAAAIVALFGWFVLRRLKSGKPAGYLFGLLFKSGLVLFIPGLFRPRGLLRPPAPFATDRTTRLSPFFSSADMSSVQVRFFYDI